MEQTNSNPLSQADLLELARWNTPTIYNGWEQITKSDAGRDGFNLEECHDFMPEMGPMAGYAITVVAEPSNKVHPRQNPNGWSEYQRYVASIPGPKIAVVQEPRQAKHFRLLLGRGKQLYAQCPGLHWYNHRRRHQGFGRNALRWI